MCDGVQIHAKGLIRLEFRSRRQRLASRRAIHPSKRNANGAQRGVPTPERQYRRCDADLSTIMAAGYIMFLSSFGADIRFA
jgi:hypothetical protein